ncbi:MAG: ATP-binding cassette, subfamily bacterial, partial [Gaiellaceae bacterium]|nr:ATP-binding cassette, subfamily bacterial [Gaiellaceae bacterium]
MSWPSLRDIRRNVRGSLLWTLLMRQRRWVKWAPWVVFGAFVVLLLVAQATVAMIDNGVVAQAVPLRAYVNYIAFLSVIGFGVGVISRQIVSRIGYQIEFDLRAWLYTSVQSAELEKSDAILTGQLVSRAMTDINVVQQVLEIAPRLLGIVPLMFALILYLLIVAPLLALLATAALPINIWLLRRFRKRLWALSWAELNERAQVAAAVDEPVRGIRVVKAFGREQHEQQRVAAVANRTYRFSMSRLRLLARYDVPTKLIPLAANALVLFVGARLVNGGNLSLGTFVIAFQVASGLSVIAQTFDLLASAWQYLRGAQTRLAEILALGSEPTVGRPLEDEAIGFELRGVTVELGGQPVLENFDLTVHSGELVSLSGPPQSGKTTIASVVGGLVQPQSGAVLLDDQPMSEMDITTVRKAVRVVREDPVLFSGSVRHNLDLGAAWQTSESELLTAIDTAGAADVIDALPNGLDTHVGDRGLTLSGGQRQRIALARALVARPRVIVLDDALSAVNPSLEIDIVRRIRNELPDAAILCISRRPGPATIADRSIHLDDLERVAGEVEIETAAGSAVSVDQVLMDAVADLDLSADQPLCRETDGDHDTMPRVGWLGRLMAGAVLLAIAVLLTNAAAKLGPNILFGQATDAVNDRRIGDVTPIVGLVLLVAVAYVLSGYVLRVTIGKIAQTTAYLLRRRIFRRLCALGIDFYDRELPGDVATRVVNDIDRVLEFMNEQAVLLFAPVATMLAGLAAVVIIAPPAAPAVGLIFLVLLAMTAIQLPISMRALNLARGDLGKSMALFEEHFAGRAELRSCGGVAKADRQFMEQARALRQSRRFATSVSNVYTEGVQFLTNVGSVLVLLQAGNAVLAGSLAVGSALSARLITNETLQPLPMLSTLYERMLNLRVSWQQLKQPFESPVLPVERPDAVTCPPIAGEIVFDDVHFTYPGLTRPVLHGAAFTIAPGSVTAVVGYTGA